MSGLDRVALVHDRLDQDGGAERVLWTLHEIFPQAPIYTAMWNRRAVPRFEGCDVRVAWMKRLPGINRAPRGYAALYPIAFAQLDLSGYDLVISCTTAFAHGARTRPGTLHVCYCSSPSNFVWRPRSYFTSATTRVVTAPLRSWLKAWERRAATNPDVYVANGRAVAERIRAFYGRESAIIPPPIRDFWFTDHQRDDFYLVAGRLVAQKRVDLAIRASSRLRVPLVVVGTGRDAPELQRIAGPSVSFPGRVSDEELRQLYASARALILPGEEDFGMVPLEAQAAGTPVVAFDGGGARETVVQGVTGIRFRPQTVEGLIDGLDRASRVGWDQARIRAHARGFTESRFREEVLGLVENHSRRPETAPAGHVRGGSLAKGVD